MSDNRSAIGASLRVKDVESKISLPSRSAIAIRVALFWAMMLPAGRLSPQQTSPFAITSGRPTGYWRKLALGFGLSLFAHESAHVLSSLAMGFHPYVGFDHGRPTIYSGIDTNRYPHKQFIFSASGLTTQAVLDELLLDIPHSSGAAIKRGIVAGWVEIEPFFHLRRPTAARRR